MTDRSTQTRDPRYTDERLEDRLERAEAELAEARETLRAIQEGDVDALVVRRGDDVEIYSLSTADRPYRIMMEQMNEGAVSLSDSGTVLYSNWKFAELVGRPLERVVGRSFESFFTDTGSWSEFSEDLEPELEHEHELVSGDGIIPVKISLARLDDEGDVSFCGVITDLTRQKDHERLRDSERKLRDSDRRKDEFLAMLGHELRNPLAPLGHAVHLLQSPDITDERRSWALEMMGRQLGFIERIIDDLLDTDRINRGKIELARDAVDLRDILSAAVEMIGPFLTERGHRLRTRLSVESVTVIGDRTRLAQIVSNLLHNAGKFTPEGGEVELVLTRTGTHASIVVRDNGNGIDASLIPNVFEMFTQAAQSLDRRSGGLGMGLNIVRNLVQLQGGTVTARSEGAGKGSEFEVVLPVVDIGAEDAVTASSSAADPVGNPETALRVLVVDDNTDAADALALLLNKMVGYETRAAYDGVAALDAAQEFRPDVVCLDLGLPGMDGFEVARHLRERYGKALKLYALTGYGQDSDRVTTGEAGFDHHFVKPLELEEFFAVVRA